MVGNSARGVLDWFGGGGEIRRATYRLLDNDRRRYALYYLMKHREAGQQSLGDMAEQIAAWENGVSRSAVSTDERKHVYNSLQQFHLSKLSEYDIARYDADGGTVEITRQGRVLARVLFMDPTREHTWRVAYGILGISGVVVALALLYGSSVLSVLNPILILLMFSLLLTVVSVSHILYVWIIVRLSDQPPSASRSATNE